MKVHSAYLQNQIPPSTQSSKTSEVGKTTQFDKIIDKAKSTKIEKTQKNDIAEFKLNNVTERILTHTEKSTIAAYFNNTDQNITKAYTQEGKSVNMEVIIGKKVDIRG